MTLIVPDIGMKKMKKKKKRSEISNLTVASLNVELPCMTL